MASKQASDEDTGMDKRPEQGRVRVREEAGWKPGRSRIY